MSVVVRGLRGLWWFVRLEVQLYLALARWVVRRPDVPAGARGWGYSRLVTPVMWLWIFGSACELPIAHVLVPWHGVRIALLAVGFWGLVWMVGLLASLKVHPHLLDAEGMTVRHGRFVRLRVPWDSVASVRRDDRDAPGGLRSLRPVETAAGTEVLVPVNGRVNVVVRLSEALRLATPQGEVEAVALGIWLDDPQAFAAEATRTVGAGA